MTRYAPVAAAPAAAVETEPVPATPGPARPRDLPSLTGMRWAAALLVFGTHVRIVQYFGGGAAHTVQTALSPGSTGVSFFFVLSGFVLAWTARPQDRARSFWRRRFARVYPLHLATALGVLILAWTILPSARPSPSTLVANLLLVQSWSSDHVVSQSINTVSWSLACEAFFYLLFPLLYGLLRRCGARGSALLAAGCVLTVIALPIVFGEAIRGVPLDLLPLARLPEFVLGMALGRLVQLRPVPRLRMIPAGAVLVAGYFGTDNVPHPYRYAACTIVGFALLIVAGAGADLAGRRSIWRHPLMVRLGEVSFAFYMVHLVVMRVGATILGSHPRLDVWPATGVSVTMFVAALTLAWLCHTLIERPAQEILLGRAIPALFNAGRSTRAGTR